ncbi:tRNA epoxyqueuosine(34) reductase QueG [Occallatibacter savannae]|uniref:tRNA epoxyqueuosine(34) reductase QueG n=1 Tax=Occallatibacter savannae TaxID=1002691 RepID=UPI000D68F872|nr:tRNA epoxyqueuosine(34) reductase QueG [Occallatibacter savannae]
MEIFHIFDSAGALLDSKSTNLTREAAYALATGCGFTNAGLVPLPHAAESRDASRFTSWIQAGRAGSMRYLERVSETSELVRARVAVPFPWARSAIVCFASYNSAHPRSTEDAPRSSGWIARYAWSSRIDEKGERRPSDYHKVLLKRLKSLDAKLRERCGEFESRAYVDTGPVVERSLAVAAGLGWTGKNTCLIHPKLGSFGFLCVLLTSLDVAAEDRTPQMVSDHCGTCTRCLDACPTNALTAPYQMDATKCISYLTIEHKAPIAPELMSGMGRQIFGCDICQDVCPWNRKAPISADTELQPREELVNPSLEWLASLDEQQWERLFNGSPVRRSGFLGFKRNLAVAMGNAPGADESLLERLKLWSEDADPALRTAAEWALHKHSQESTIE